MIVEVGEHVASRWLVTRGRENVSDLLPGPILPASIHKELLDAHVGAGRLLVTPDAGVRIDDDAGVMLCR